MSKTLTRNRLRGIKMFDLKKEKVEIKDNNGNVIVYELSPLKGQHLEGLFSSMKKFDEATKGNEGEVDQSAILDLLGSDVSGTLHSLVLESLKSSYPDEDVDKLNAFAAQNLVSFIGPLMTANMPSSE